MFPTKQRSSRLRRAFILFQFVTVTAFGQHLTSARGSALGAFTALSDDIASIDWNPAGLVSIRDWDLTASSYAAFRRDVPLKGISLYTAGTAKRFLDAHVVAASYSPGMNLDFIEPSSFSFQGDSAKIDNGRRISYREEFALAYGYQVTPTVGLGISARYREQYLTDTRLITELGILGRIETLNFSGSAWNIDVGLNWKPEGEWSFGAVAKNLFRLTESELPQDVLKYALRNVKTLRVGAAYQASQTTVFAFDFDTQARGGFGAEWRVAERWALRQGVLFGGTSSQFVAGFSGGVGFSYGPAKLNLSYVQFLKSRSQPSVQEFVDRGVQDLGYNAFTPSQILLSANISLGRTREVWAKIEYVQILSEVYPSSYQLLASRPLGKARVKNISSKPISAKVSFFVDQYMDGPTETPRPVYIEPNAEADVPFYAIFNDAIRFVPSMVLRAAEVFVKASPAEDYDDKSQTRVIIRGRNDWDGDALTLRYFVTPEDPDIMRFTRSVMSQNKDTMAAATRQLEKFRSARLLFNEFATRLTYVNDPKASKDRVQFPSETLVLRGGDCDDMTVCFSSLLSSVGISTAFIDVVPPQRMDEAHIFMMFDTGVPAAQAKLISDNPKRYVVRKNERGEETVWVPVETTAITEGFQRAWEVGAKEYFDSVEVGLGVVRGWVRLVDLMLQ
ncbi:MAG: hypothetical protein NTU47_14205 [Ignavibacteriales bacterium]|nr:hypothetical protein [Ignavibacteriales bacterium]